VPSTRKSKRKLLLDRLAQLNLEKVGETEWQQLRTLLAPVSERYLRNLLRESGLRLEPLIEGIRQDSFENLERTLLAVGGELTAARQSDDRERERRCRRQVIIARDHAQLSLRSPSRLSTARSIKEEMIDWMRVWLENPEVFPLWLELRKREMGAAGAGN